MACQFRSKEPTPELIASKTKTGLDLDIVATIVESALGLLPPDDMTAGIQQRREKAIEKAKKA